MICVVTVPILIMCGFQRAIRDQCGQALTSGNGCRHMGLEGAGQAEGDGGGRAFQVRQAEGITWPGAWRFVSSGKAAHTVKP